MPKTDIGRFFAILLLIRCGKGLKYKSLLKFSRLLSKKWRWRESNPRPNKEPPWLLHAYSAVGFRAAQGNERPKRDLIS